MTKEPKSQLDREREDEPEREPDREVELERDTLKDLGPNAEAEEAVKAGFRSNMCLEA